MILPWAMLGVSFLELGAAWVIHPYSATGGKVMAAAAVFMFLGSAAIALRK